MVNVLANRSGARVAASVDEVRKGTMAVLTGTLRGIPFRAFQHLGTRTCHTLPVEIEQRVSGGQTMHVITESDDRSVRGASHPRTVTMWLITGLAMLLVVAGCGRSDDSDAIGVGGATTIRDITTTTAPVSETVATEAPPPTQVTYVVQSGDSLSVIAQRFGVSTQELADFNAIADVSTIKIGQELTIPPVTTTTEAPASADADAAETSESSAEG